MESVDTFVGILWALQIHRKSAPLVSLINAPPFSWTKLEFLVEATDTNSILEIQAENDPGYFALDDIYVTPIPAPRLQAYFQTVNSCNLSWPTAPGVAYQVQYATNLIQPNWTDLVSPFVASGSVFSAVDTNLLGSSQRFYRLVLPWCLRPLRHAGAAYSNTAVPRSRYGAKINMDDTLVFQNTLRNYPSNGPFVPLWFCSAHLTYSGLSNVYGYSDDHSTDHALRHFLAQPAGEKPEPA